MKHRWIIQGAGADPELIGFSDRTTMHEVAEMGAEVAHGIPGARGFGRERLSVTREPVDLAWKAV
jgi:hypothetical protein